MKQKKKKPDLSETSLKQRMAYATLLGIMIVLTQMLLGYVGVVPAGFTQFVKYHPDKAAIVTCRMVFESKNPEYVQRCMTDSPFLI